MGADYWNDLSFQWAGWGVNNDDVGIGRFKYVTPEWNYYTMHTFSEEEVKSIIFPTNLNVAPPSSTSPSLPRQPLNTGITIYEGFPNRELRGVYYWGEGTDFTLFNTNNAQREFSIRWGNADQGTGFVFEFYHSEDFTRLVSEGYNLEFKARAARSVNLNVRFLNDISFSLDKRFLRPESAIPWRMGYTVNLPAGGAWQTIRVPLRNMREQGAWVQATSQFLNPQGAFSWANVWALEFASDDSDMKGITVWIDDIKVTR